MISQLFILSARGDVIIRRDFQGNVPRSSPETFFRNCKFWKEGDEAPPVFLVDGVTYIHLKDGGVEVVATCRDNLSPSFVLEFLRRACTLIKDYCGTLSEEAIRKNFVLIYELLDEMVDYGMPQSTSTEALKSFVLNEPTVVEPPMSGSKAMFSLSKGPTGVFKSVLDTNRTDGKRRDEIFVDVVERMTCTFNANGYLTQSQVDGSVQIKSYLAGNPPIKIKLNDDLMIGRRDTQASGGLAALGAGRVDSGVVFLDDCQFHEVANLESFDTDRTITLVPPEGEFALLNYRTSSGIKPPFRLQTSLEADPTSETKALLTLRLWCEIPPERAASGLEIEVPTPKYVQRAHCDLDAKAAATQSWEFSEKTHLLRWKFKRVAGGQEATLRARLTLERPFGPTVRSEVGPVNLRFTIPMHSASRIALKYLQILKRDKNYNPFRWVRYVTSSTSYTFRT
mmetsp:Transcript_22213/g.38009  ORF Transcript_22213/g.38009 Transcript_22213/m.38009 type:complete len:453 (+) Transcript_22213:117-1475(+)|eukprot:CAMPEP_0119114182 /NCGR_PEP_ID=MMETSP1180-20130426/46474_1 /TAXON_ID=3052 ORGANISM="Chlamydomonas cf sp, Strain CCMP681" /NCGR_SAMPLE_ID=MMETSP1180 /ASSEMBLY_ACC=CAM_ASM_000741 /LENGTH=452 /DNA_ID=CAMNT_0007102601 /DNA_START=113 /DNA_END=1471 /DNA_ORIENTATION=+